MPEILAGFALLALLAVLVVRLVSSSGGSDTGERLAGNPAAATLPAVPPVFLTSPAASASPAATTPVVPVSPANPPSSGVVSYVVQPGDTLYDIAAWFALNGYRDLYEQNKAVIGETPALIRPGQIISVWPGGASTVG